MTQLRGFVSAGGVAALGLLLAGCLGGGSSGMPIRPAPTGVEGAWMDANGILSTFSAGSFQTVTTDTGQTLSQGTYVMTGQNSVHITGTSLLRNTQISINCNLISANQLNCTSSGGQQFGLTRRA